MNNYYNEFSKFPADWIRNLIKAGIVPGGCVDVDNETYTRYSCIMSRIIKCPVCGDKKPVRNDAKVCSPFAKKKKIGKNWILFFDSK